MVKQMRAVIFDNGTPKAVEYSNELFRELGAQMETHQVNVYDARPCTQIIPVRAIPNIAVMLYADTLEEGQEILDIARQLEFFREQDKIQQTGEKLITDGVAAGTVDGTTVVDAMILLPEYKPEGLNGDYWHQINETCTYGNQPWRCCQAYNAQNNPDIYPGNAPAHWVQYHTKNPEQALPFIHPTGAHDTYMLDECMRYTDGLVYRSTMDNNAYSPEEYAQGWEAVG